MDDGPPEMQRLKYGIFTEVRDSARRILRKLIERHKTSLFAGICGRCGNCCRGRAVLMNAQEMVKVYTFLGLTEEEFRSAYITPASTWNEMDGFLKSKDGNCVFLELVSARKHYCAIHPVRPFICTAVFPTLNCCDKDPDLLAGLVNRIELSTAGISIFLTDGRSLTTGSDDPIAGECLLELSYSLLGVSDYPDESWDNISFQTGKLIEDLSREVDVTGAFPISDEVFSHLISIVNEIDGASQEKRGDPEVIKGLWEKVRRFMEMRRGRVRVQDLGMEVSREQGSLQQSDAESGKGISSTGAGSPGPESRGPVGTGARSGDRVTFALQEMHLAQSTLFIKGAQNDIPFERVFSYRDYPSLLQPVRRFLELLIKTGDYEITESLSQIDNECVMCGECCRIFNPEISPDDIERMARHLKIREEDVWSRYLEPGRFSWNGGEGIIKRMALDGGKKECVFLKKKGENTYYCTIYEARSETCRKFSPDQNICRVMSIKQGWQSHARNIISLIVTDEFITMSTYFLHSKSKPPLRIPLASHRHLAEARDIIREAVGELCAV